MRNRALMLVVAVAVAIAPLASCGNPDETDQGFLGEVTSAAAPGGPGSTELVDIGETAEPGDGGEGEPAEDPGQGSTEFSTTMEFADEQHPATLDVTIRIGDCTPTQTGATEFEVPLDACVSGEAVVSSAPYGFEPDVTRINPFYVGVVLLYKGAGSPISCDEASGFCKYGIWLNSPGSDGTEPIAEGETLTLKPFYDRAIGTDDCGCGTIPGLGGGDAAPDQSEATLVAWADSAGAGGGDNVATELGQAPLTPGGSTAPDQAARWALPR